MRPLVYCPGLENYVYDNKYYADDEPEAFIDMESPFFGINKKDPHPILDILQEYNFVANKCYYVEDIYAFICGLLQAYKIDVDTQAINPNVHADLGDERTPTIEAYLMKVNALVSKYGCVVQVLDYGSDDFHFTLIPESKLDIFKSLWLALKLNCTVENVGILV